MTFAQAFRRGAALARALAMLAVLAAFLAAPAASAQDNFLWSVEDGAGAKLFLFGSIHLATPGTYPLPEAIDRAFASSVQLVVEADVTSPDLVSTMTSVTFAGIYRDGKTLWDEIGPELSEGLKKCAAKTKLPDELFVSLRPWLAAMTLEAMRLKAMGFQEELGLDRHFIMEAKEGKIPVGELESMAEQMEIFTSLTPEESLQLLRVTVLECEESENDVRELISVWQRGDLDGFERLYFQVYNQYPELSPLLDKIINDRNDRMHARLQPYLYPGRTAFVVVGAAHMVGARGLPELFRAQGLKVTRY
jgi:uncharacterized protein YbaP (TraB family)